ncbi:MAG: hypothetical protein EPN85_10900 [Bacteroidetes bacterium]|nr:MAG: hypothetical protein EPN85_10900 [Bacteroidota bacterium]
MKTPSDELFRIIKSMNKQEKIHFTLYCSRKEKNNHSLKLFNAMNAMKQYDESRMRKKLKDKRMLRNLKRIKSYTGNAVLSSLREYHSDDSVSIQLQRHLQTIEILSGKGLYDTAMKAVSKAEKLAIANDCYNYLFIILEQKYMMMFPQQNPEAMRKYANEGYVNELKYRDIDKNILEYKRLYAHQECIKTSHGENPTRQSIKALKTLLKNPMLQNESRALSHTAETIRYQTLGHVYLELEDWEKCSLFLGKSIRLFEQKPSYQQDRMNSYIHSMAISIPALTSLGKKDEIALMKDKAERFISALPGKLRTNSLYSRYLALMINYINYHLESWNMQEALKSSEEIKMIVEKSGDIKAGIVFYANLSMLHFYMRDYRKALHCINKILTMQTTDVRQDITNAAKIINIVIHYELGNEEMLPGLCKSTHHYLKKKKALNKVWELMLWFFLRTPAKQAAKKEKTSAFAELKKQLELIASEPDKKKILYYFDFISWTESKIKNRPFSEVVRDKQFIAY